MKNRFGKLVLVLIVIALITAFFTFDLGQYLTLDYLKSQRETFTQYYQENQVTTIAIYALIYILSTALSLPGATILTLAGGALFGLGVGLLAVSFASTIGATCAFLVARFLLKDYVQNKFKSKLATFNEGIEKEGAFYLFTLRLVPIFPFFMINLAMGLTPIRTLTYFFVSQLGMLPGTAVYVNAGTQLSQIDSLKGILSPELLFSFALLGIVPLVSKKTIDYIKSRKYLKNYKKPSQFEYNMVVIGAGAAGLVSSYIAAAVKAKVALIEKHKMGGDCLNTGCVPSKALIKTAKVLKNMDRAEDFGLERPKVEFDFSKVMERVQRVVKTIEPHDSVERYTGLGVECIQGEAKIKSPYEVEVNGRTLTTKNIIVATGARPFVPPIPGIEKVNPLTSDNLWDIREKPEKLLVLGGGPIGCELAQSFQRLGCQVTQVEMASKIMAREDEDVADYMTEVFKKEGINVLTGHRAKQFNKDESSGKKELIAEFNGKDVKIEFDQVIVAVGRRANVKGFGLEELDVKISKQGTIEADEFLRTNYPNIFVCGDVTGPYQFTHTAAHMAWYASVNALFSPFKKFKVDYRVIPWATFSDPEVARVGLNEKDAKAKGIEYMVTKYGIDDLDRAIADEEAHGFVKVLTPPGKDTILGATIVGAHAGDLITEFISGMKHGFGLNKILGTIHIYPTFAESNKYLAGNWKKATKPEKLLGYVEKFHRWRL